MQEGRYKDGFEAGQEWAKQTAEVNELERLDLYRRSARSNEWDYFFDTEENSAYSGGYTLHLIIHPEQEGRAESDAFWERVAGPDYNVLSRDGDYVLGFAEGALAVWNEVKDQL